MTGSNQLSALKILDQEGGMVAVVERREKGKLGWSFGQPKSQACNSSLFSLYVYFPPPSPPFPPLHILHSNFIDSLKNASSWLIW